MENQQRILYKCLLCRRLQVKPKPQFLSDLLEERLAVNETAFTYIGVDYFSPITLKQSKKTRTNSGQSKCYSVVFICLTTSNAFISCRRLKCRFLHFSTTHYSNS